MEQMVSYIVQGIRRLPTGAVNEQHFISEFESKSSRVFIFQLLFVIRAADGSQHSRPLSHLSEYPNRTSRIWVSESDLD